MVWFKIRNCLFLQCIWTWTNFKFSNVGRNCYLAWKKGKQNHYMLGTKKTYSITEIAKSFKTKIKFMPARPGERFGSTTLNDNAKKILGYNPKIDIKDYIKELITNN